MSETVKVFKFISGQEIVAKVIDRGAGRVTVESPLALQPHRQDPSAGVSIALVPFSWGGNASVVTLNDAHILCELDAEDYLSSQYLAGLAGISIPNEPAQTGRLTLVE